MKNIWTIAHREFKTYFTSPFVYVIGFVVLGLSGFMFYSHLSYVSLQAHQYQLTSLGKAPSLTDQVIRPFFGNVNVLLLMLLPLVTMRLFAEEKKNHTIELLMTAPVSLGEIILGKFFGSLLLILFILLVSFVFPAFLYTVAKPEWGPIFTNYLGLILLVSCYLSIGALFSAVTENQLVAAALTWGFSIFFWLISWASQMAGPVWGDLLTYLSLIGHNNSFGVGLIDTSDVVFYLSFTGIVLFLTHRVLDSYRWR